MRQSIVLIILQINIGVCLAQSSPGTIYNAKNQSAVGSIASDAIEMDVDEMWHFFGKYSVIKKGVFEALINDQGKIIFPFGKYTYSLGSSEWLRSNWVNGQQITAKYSFYQPYYGILAQYNSEARPTKLINVQMKVPSENRTYYGFIDSNAKVFMKHSLDEYDQEGYITYYQHAGLFTDDGKLKSEKLDGSLIVGQGNYLKVGNDYKQIRYRLGNFELGNYTGWSGGLRLATPIDFNPQAQAKSELELITLKNKQVGYINRKGVFQVKPGYYKGGEFSEGVAFVCRLNEFGEERWGAIDTLGNLLIPFKFTSQPGNFNNNRSVIRIANTEFDCAVINKKGDTVFKFPSFLKDKIHVSSVGGHYVGPGRTYFSHGYALIYMDIKDDKDEIGTLFVDTSGVPFPVIRMLRKHFPNGERISIVSNVKNEQFLFSVTSNNSSGTGIADINGDIILPPVFSDISLFEPESQLQYAEFGRKNYMERGTRGYIDRNGIFRIILKPKS
jgi:hypothetical protein